MCRDFAVETDTPTALEAFLADVDGDVGVEPLAVRPAMWLNVD